MKEILFNSWLCCLSKQVKRSSVVYGRPVLDQALLVGFVGYPLF
ncbi:MAG: hypothetical protein ACMUEM_07315 [Flavobacteriales bacterium AspAUS03]